MPVTQFEDIALVQLTARAEISGSIDYSKTFNAVLLDAISRQPWADTTPARALELYAALISHPDLIALFQRFPENVSVDEIMAKVVELTPQLMSQSLANQLSSLGLEDTDVGTFLNAIWDVISRQWQAEDLDFVRELYDHQIRYNPEIVAETERYYAGEISWDELTDDIIARVSNENYFPQYSTTAPPFDPTQLADDLSALYMLAMWDKDGEANTICKVLERLESIPDVMNIGGRDVEVPFKRNFEEFLDKMKDRQGMLRQLEAEYFGAQERENNWLLDLLGRGGGMGAKRLR